MVTSIKVCAIALGIVLANVTASFGSSSPPGSTSSTALHDASPKGCCKVCRKGKACGDSCIAREKQCHQPPGCACDG